MTNKAHWPPGDYVKGYVRPVTEASRQDATGESMKVTARMTPELATKVTVANRLQSQLDATHRDIALHAQLQPGELREVVETDRTGRKISRFIGDPNACWAPFKSAVRVVVGFDTGRKK